MSKEPTEPPKPQKDPNCSALIFPSVKVTHHIEWLWQKSRAEMICLKNFLASLGVNRPFFTR